MAFPSPYAAWANRKLLTFGTHPSSEVDDFPALVTFTADADLSNLESDFRSLRFAMADGVTPLYHQPDFLTGGGGTVSGDATHAVTGAVRVRVPVTSAVGTNQVMVYWGNSGATDGQSTSVWRTAFQGAWSLRETGIGSAGDYKDITSHAQNSTNTADQPSATTGPYGLGAESFNGTSQYISVGHIAGLASATQASLVGWIYRGSTDDTVGFGQETLTHRFNIDWDGTVVYCQCENNGYSWPYFPLTGTGWHQVAITLDAGTLLAHLDGSPATLTGDGGSPATSLASSALQPDFVFGRDDGRYRGGKVAAVATTNTILSADEIAIEHTMVVNAGSDLTWGSVESGGGTVYTFSPDSIAQGHALAAASIGQIHALSPDALAESQSLAAGTIGQIHILSPDALAEIQTLGAAALSQLHVLSPDSLSESQALAAAGLSQTHMLGPDSLGESQALASAAITQIHSLSPASLANLQTLDVAGMSQVHVLAADGLSQAQLLDLATLTQTHFLSPDALFQAMRLSASFHLVLAQTSAGMVLVAIPRTDASVPIGASRAEVRVAVHSSP